MHTGVAEHGKHCQLVCHVDKCTEAHANISEGVHHNNRCWKGTHKVEMMIGEHFPTKNSGQGRERPREIWGTALSHTDISFPETFLSSRTGAI